MKIKFFTPISLLLILLLVLPATLEARRGGGGMRSFGSSSWGRSSRSSSWGSARSRRPSTTQKATIWGGTKSASRSGSAATAATRSRGGAAATNRANYYKQAKRNNTVYGSRAEAGKAFETRYRNNYPNRFSSKPKQRPNYVPQSTTLSGGQSVPISYNQSRGAYGYRDPLTGGFMLYSVFRDAAMLSLLMNHNNYYYGAAPPAIYSTAGASFLRLALWLLIVFGAMSVIGAILRRRQ